MPRSTNPSNYEEVYWDLLHGMRQEIPEIKLELPANTAQKVKFTFYAFIRALEVQADKKRKTGNMTGAGELDDFANAMRKYLILIEINGSVPIKIDRADVTPSILRFINRDLNPMTASMREQVKKQLEMFKPPDFIESATKQPSIDSFFSKPLEITDDEPNERATDGGVPADKTSD